MPTVDVERERITVFHIGSECYVSHFFDRPDLFEDFRKYDVTEAYRFEVPDDEFERVRERLREAYYDPVVVEEPEALCVVTGRYDEHADILRESVLHWERRGHLCFLMKSELAAEEALEQGAMGLVDTEFVRGI